MILILILAFIGVFENIYGAAMMGSVRYASGATSFLSHSYKIAARHKVMQPMKLPFKSLSPLPRLSHDTFWRPCITGMPAHTGLHTLARQSIGLEPMRVEKPTYDHVFKRVFGDEVIVKSFLNSIYALSGAKEITDVKFLTVEEPKTAFSRSVIFDILCVDEQGAQYIIEIQKKSHSGFAKRAVLYAAKQLVKQFDNMPSFILKNEEPVRALSRDLYPELLPVKTLIITDFKMFKELQQPVSFWDIRWHHPPHDIASGIFSWGFVQLPEFKKKPEQLTQDWERWLYFLRRQRREMVEVNSMLTGDNPAILSAYDRAAHLTEKEKKLSEMEEKAELDEAAVLSYAQEKGIQQGRKERDIEIARNLKKAGVAIDIIKTSTNLTEDEIKELSI